MHCVFVLGAAALLAGGAKAAPKAPEDEVLAHLVHGRTFHEPVPVAGAKPGRGRPGYHHNGTNATTSAATGGAASSTFPQPFNSKSTLVPSACPLSVVTSTMTFDITLYITATTSYGNLTSSFHTGSTQPSFTPSRLDFDTTTSHTPRNISSTMIERSTRLTRSINSSVTVSSSASEAPYLDATRNTQLLQNTTASASYTSTSSSLVVQNTTSPSKSIEPCDDISSASRSDSSTTATASSTPFNSTTAWFKHTSTTGVRTTAPCDEETSTATGISEQYTYTSDATTNQISSCATPIPSESCIIDTSMAPVTSALLTLVPSSTLAPTKTVCRDDAPTGKPLPENQHCGVHGLPVGNYFLARFVENLPGVPVTLEGCYQFCASVINATDGCKSYRFYAERGLNVPRCDLFGSNVAYALDSIDNDHPDLWFDLTCDSPSDAMWSHLTGIN